MKKKTQYKKQKTKIKSKLPFYPYKNLKITKLKKKKKKTFFCTVCLKSANMTNTRLV